ncbi:hypothetical protein Angca_000430, partial [Angiostrongylus cantonensis]
ITGIFKKGAAHLDYPVSELYEGPLDSTQRIDDIQGEPLTHHVTVYHSGRSDEPAPKPDEAHIDLADAAKTFGDKITGLFKKGAAHLDYPVSELYEGPLDSTQRIDDIQGEPLTHHVTVYHSGRSDEPAPKPEEAHIDLADAAKTFGDKITGLFRRRPTIPDYPPTEPYYGPLADTRRREDIDSQPLHTTVTVYHSGRSDIPHEKVVFVPQAVEVHKEMHYDYPSTTAYEGPLDSTQRIDDIQGEPLTHHVTVYHSGRSDEPAPKPDEAHIDLADAAKTFGDKITGLFKKGAAHLDYPVSELYEGPLDSTQRIDDIQGEPLTHHVTVYHSGRSDEPAPKPDEAHIDLADAAKTFGDKITGLFKKGAAHLDYPVSELYEGPLDSTQRIDDIQGEPLTHHVTMYHSGRSDEPAPKPDEAHIDLADAAKTFGDKITGLFKKGAAHLDYPVSELYEGPLDSTQRIDDIQGEPLTHHVTVYHSGRSDEPAPKPDEAHIDLADAAKTFGDKITGLFRRRPTIPDYPPTEPYYGPLADTRRREDIDSQPLHTTVTVYHSGRSDIPHEKVVFVPQAVEVHKEMHYDYPTTTAYEGPLDSTQRIDDIQGEPLTHHVTVYHSGRSDEPAPKPDEAHIDLADAAKTFGDKITGLFKKGAAHLDYPVSELYEAYEGPLDSTQRIDDIHGEPLTHHVTVYHSGRSDEPAPKRDETHIDLADAAKTFGDKITGLFKKGAAHLDYPVSELYEGPLDSTQRIDEIQGEPLTHHVTVYHSGRSDEPAPKPDEAHIDLADAAKTFGDEITGLFKKGAAHLDYPVSELYEGPLDSTQRIDDIQGEPLTHHAHIDFADAAKTFGDKITGLFKKGAAHLDYPVSELYEGPLDSTQRIDDIQGEPLTHHVTMYHSGRSDEPAPKPDEAHIDLADAAKTFGDKITGLFKKGAAHLDYPVSELYEGLLDSTQRIDDIQGEPLTHHVTVYHSGRSDEAAPKPDEAHIDLADAAKTFGDKITGLFKKGAAHLDYPVSELYEGRLDSTQRIDDIQGEPLTHHVTVYHSGRSDEPVPELGQTCTDLIDLVDAENITPVFKRGAALLDYPVSDVYSGALENMCRTSDIDAVPLIHHVRVFH